MSSWDPPTAGPIPSAGLQIHTTIQGCVLKAVAFDMGVPSLQPLHSEG